MSTRSIFNALAVVLVATLGGCAHPGSGLPVGSFERGIAEYGGERYLDSIETLRLFIRRNPTDPRVDEAQYHIGLARFDAEEYAVAAVEFEILRSDYPNSDLVEDSWMMEGRCYLEQLPSIHHEQSVTRRALAHYQRYLREYPDGEFSAEARERVDDLLLHLDRKRMAAVRLYARLGRDRAALVSVEALLDERPDSQLRPEALLIAGDLHEELGEFEQARTRWRQLLDEHGTDELAPRAQERLERTRREVGEAR